MGDKEGEEAGTSKVRRMGLTSAVVADGPWAGSGVGLVDGRVPGGGVGAREAIASIVYVSLFIKIKMMSPTYCSTSPTSS
jgi:hypothetical protein